MRKKTIVLWAAVVALCLPLAPPVSAGEISGTGTIWAKGAGLAIPHGHGEIVIRAHGVGIVWIKDANSLEASGRGHKWEVAGNNATVFWGWSGEIRASGDSITVWMADGIIEFRATGTGSVYLRGRGNYEANGHEGLWRPAGVILTLDAARHAR